jgi:predicted transcriptional regulator
MTPPHLEGVEAQAMEYVWEQGQATVRDVMTALNTQKSRAYTTYMTVLVRLHKKGLLDRSEQDGAMLYTPAITRQEYVQADVKALIAQHGDLALSEFARQVADLDPQRQAALKRLADQ